MKKRKTCLRKSNTKKATCVIMVVIMVLSLSSASFADFDSEENETEYYITEEALETSENVETQENTETFLSQEDEEGEDESSVNENEESAESDELTENEAENEEEKEIENESTEDVVIEKATSDLFNSEIAKAYEYICEYISDNNLSVEISLEEFIEAYNFGTYESVDEFIDACIDDLNELEPVSDDENDGIMVTSGETDEIGWYDNGNIQ